MSSAPNEGGPANAEALGEYLQRGSVKVGESLMQARFAKGQMAKTEDGRWRP